MTSPASLMHSSIKTPLPIKNSIASCSDKSHNTLRDVLVLSEMCDLALRIARLGEISRVHFGS